MIKEIKLYKGLYISDAIKLTCFESMLFKITFGDNDDCIDQALGFDHLNMLHNNFLNIKHNTIRNINISKL
jgi:hypothetical protein